MQIMAEAMQSGSQKAYLALETHPLKKPMRMSL